MYINNPKDLNPDTYIIVTRSMSEYLVGKGFPILSRENNKYYFSKTPEVQQAIKSTPVWLKVKQFII
jgi:hypothetical protein